MYRIPAILILLFVFSHALYAQPIGLPSDYVKWETTISADEVATGNTFSITHKAKISAGWKMYAMNSPTPSWGVKLQLDDLPAGFQQVGDIDQHEPKEGYDPNFKIDVVYFENEATLVSTFEVDESAGKGLQVISGKVGYQICNDKVCLPPRYEPFITQLDVVDEATGAGSSSGTEPGNLEPGDTGGADLSEAETREIPSFVIDQGDAELVLESQEDIASGSAPLSRQAGGLWGFILLAIGAGLGALLMPCVFPMIPLTVSYFTKHAHDRQHAVRMAGVYGLSIIVIFTGLGILMALLIGASGAQLIAANPWVNLFIGLTFVVFALSLLGLFELQLPSGLVNYFNRQGNERRGYTGVLFMGATLTMVSFSCTAPFVGGLLAATAGGEWTYPIIGMLVFSATFSLPFVLFALFPSGLTRLPSSGSWMNTLKVVFGFIELAAAIKFLSNADLVWGWNIISRPMAIAVTVVILFLAGLYLIGKLRLSHDPPTEAIGTPRLIFSIGFFGLSLYMLPGLFGAPLNNLDAFLPPRLGSDMSLVASISSVSRETVAEEDWFEDRESAYAEASQLGKPVFIDFTGYTCTNCRQMESTVFPQMTIAERFDQKYVLLRLYTDDLEEGPELQRFQLKLTGTVALPTYAIVDPGTGSLISQRSGLMPVNEFADFLDSGAAVFSEQYLAAYTE